MISSKDNETGTDVLLKHRHPIISWASLVAQLVKNLPTMLETWVGKIPWRTERFPTPVFWPRE